MLLKSSRGLQTCVIGYISKNLSEVGRSFRALGPNAACLTRIGSRFVFGAPDVLVQSSELERPGPAFDIGCWMKGFSVHFGHQVCLLQ